MKKAEANPGLFRSRMGAAYQMRTRSSGVR